MCLASLFLLIYRDRGSRNHNTVFMFCILQEKFSQIDILILMTAAVCHDLDHPGYNNTWVCSLISLPLKFIGKVTLVGIFWSIRFSFSQPDFLPRPCCSITRGPRQGSGLGWCLPAVLGSVKKMVFFRFVFQHFFPQILRKLKILYSW